MSELGTNDDLGTLAGLQRMAQEEALAKVNDKRMLRQAAHLLENALTVLTDRWLTSHLPDCPRRRDDYDCTCGLSDLCGRIEDWCREVRFSSNVCPDCGGKGGTLPNGVQFCNCDDETRSDDCLRWICHRCEAEISSEFDRCSAPGCVGRRPEDANRSNEGCCAECEGSGLVASSFGGFAAPGTQPDFDECPKCKGTGAPSDASPDTNAGANRVRVQEGGE